MKVHVLMKVRNSQTFRFSRLLTFKIFAEKARIEAEIAAAKLATRMRAEAELKEKRERERLKLEKVFVRILETPFHSFLKNHFSGWKKPRF